MPRNVRNFWIEMEVDGRPTPIATGPRGRDGGFTAEVFIRDRGKVLPALQLIGSVNPEFGELTLEVFRMNEHGQRVFPPAIQGYSVR